VIMAETRTALRAESHSWQALPPSCTTSTACSTMTSPGRVLHHHVLCQVRRGHAHSPMPVPATTHRSCCAVAPPSSSGWTRMGWSWG
jgi:hypothetical protein